MKLKKVLVLGSGGISIGQAGEFDYSGSQCLKSLKEEGIKTVLINPNIATIQSSEGMADKIYFLPVTPYFVEKVIAQEKPQGILLAFGGQTALNCGLELDKQGVFKKHAVAVLGTPITAIRDTEDRELFVKRLNEINVKTPRSKAVTTVVDAIAAANSIGYPVMLRVAFALGGRGSGVAYSDDDVRDLATKALASVPQILVEEYMKHWKEIEYEVVRDQYDNCITVCNMENVDPMGIHTGESIVVAPSQTLTNREYHKLREIAISVIRHLKIVGECNIQYALDPKSEDYRVIEVNARLSRSSALASKATGYPLAFVAAKLALGYGLTDIKNAVTQVTGACFEPALDYVVVKVPRWDLQKFKEVDRHIGSEMKSVGEVMAIARTFEEALQKALRMLNIGVHGLVQNTLAFDDLEAELQHPTDRRIFAIAEALKCHLSVEKIHTLTGIDPFFLHRMNRIIQSEEALSTAKDLTKDLLLNAKQLGFSDFQIAKIHKTDPLDIRALRKKLGVAPSIKQIDTLAAEYPAKTNYLYTTYHGVEHDVQPSNAGMIVLGSGVYRIGSSVEFDWCCVNSIQTAKKCGYKTIMINYNPETVSTDYDICDVLYFEELTFERVMDIYEFEHPQGVILSMGGQIPNNLALRLHKANVKIIGTSPVNIDHAENRHHFSALLDKIGVDQPAWKELTSISEAKAFAARVGYPVLIRPSYVLSGSAMNVVFHEEELEKYLNYAAEVSKEYPVVISQFIENAKEIEIDAVALAGELKLYAITEHIENAGVHSGDATMVLPAQRIYFETIKRIKNATRCIAQELHITGPFNIQFIAKENKIQVIECNLRASRSFPFCSKVLKLNFIDYATRAMLGAKLPPIKSNAFDIDYVGVKAPQFSFSRLKGADPILGVEMASTGEVGCFGRDLEEAFLKALLATGFQWPRKTVLISISGDKNRFKILDSVKLLQELGFELYATEHTAEFYQREGLPVQRLYKIHEEKEPNIKTYLLEKKLDLVISMSDETKSYIRTDTYLIRRLAVDFSIPLITDVQIVKLLVEALSRKNIDDLEIKDWKGY